MIVLSHIDPQRNIARFYVLAVQPDLFGGAALVREWGPVGKPGTIRVTQCTDTAEASRRAEEIAARKCRDGYAVMSF